jgi:hypothetical protein
MDFSAGNRRVTRCRLLSNEDAAGSAVPDKNATLDGSCQPLIPDS